MISSSTNGAVNQTSNPGTSRRSEQKADPDGGEDGLLGQCNVAVVKPPHKEEPEDQKGNTHRTS
jgi:hypothetical protein